VDLHISHDIECMAMVWEFENHLSEGIRFRIKGLQVSHSESTGWKDGVHEDFHAPPGKKRLRNMQKHTEP